ncbi:MAG: histone deacetylase [Bacteroidota bacterium]
MLKVAWSPLYAHPLPEGHRFPMEKYELIPEQLTYEGTLGPDNFFEPGKISEETILLTHKEEYWEALKYQHISKREARKVGFPMSPQLVERAITIAEGTIQNAQYAFTYGVSMNTAGGTHHAYADRGEGFCVLNDQAIAINWLLAQNLIQRALIIDLDVHQGNGSAVLFQDNPAVFTLSVHCQQNYPLRKENSDLDIALPAFTEDDVYLSILEEHIPRVISQFQPDIIFYLAGVDVLQSDKLGKLSLSLAGCKERDRYVLTLCRAHELPVVVCLGGGYSPQIADIVEAHCNTFRLAQDMWF